MLAIIGSSGSGKTTLLRCLNFLETPSEGRILVNDKVLFDADDPATQREADIRRKRLHFGLVFQSFNLFPQYSAVKNVMLAMELQAKAKPDYRGNKAAIRAEIEQRALRLLDEVGLSDKAGFYPHQHLRRPCSSAWPLQRALALDPDILCFDEPTSALDPEISGEVLQAIRRLHERNMTMVIVTHEMGFAREVSTRVMFMADGGILEQGTPEQIFGNPQTPRLRSFLSAVL